MSNPAVEVQRRTMATSGRTGVERPAPRRSRRSSGPVSAEPVAATGQASLWLSAPTDTEQSDRRPLREWELDERTRRCGRRGVASARRALAHVDPS